MDEQALSELLECSVCLERLNHTSKVLPCQHTFCRRCLEEIVSTQLELRCPECRTLVTTRVEDLPPNILLVRLLEGLKTQSHVLSSKPTSYQRKRDASAEGRQHGQTSRLGWDSPQPCARALYSYEASEKDDLTFKKGDMVMLRRQVDDNWYQGELNGQIGVFPASYVQVLVPLPQIPQCRALYDFQLDDENEKDCLTFKKDEVITVIRKVDSNWIEGRKSDKIGILPLAFVELNHAAKTLISSKPPSLSMFLGSGQSSGSNRSSNTTTAAATTTTSSSSSALNSTSTAASTTTITTTATTTASQPPHSPGSLAWQGSRSSQQKRHSFTPKSDSPSPPPQVQRHSLELSASGDTNNNSTATSSATSSASSSASTSVPPVMSASMPASVGVHDKVVPPPKSSVSSTNNERLAEPLPSKTNSGSCAGSGASGSGAVSVSSLSTPIYIAMYNYRPQKDDEVELRKGDYYTVTEKCQDGWYKGQCLRTGISGVFPGNYVQIIRTPTPSAFKPVNPNVLNIRAKVPAAHNHHQQHHHGSSRPFPDSDSASPPIPPHVKTSSSTGAPPLLPRVARMSSSSSPSSSSSGRHSPHTSSHSSKSISNTHVPVTIMGGRSSHSSSGASLSSVMRATSAPSGSPSDSSHRSGASGHVSRASSSSLSSNAKLCVMTAGPDSHRRTSSPHGALVSVQHSMSTSSNITPPNVVMGPSESSSSQLALISKDREKREKRELKKGLVKLWPGKGKKSKSSSSDHIPAHLSADSVGHTRSGSYPSERSSPGSPREISQHRKTASLDSTSPSSKSRSKPQPRERYRCIVPYPPQTEHELELELGDIVHVHKRREDGWFKGTQERTSKTGLFPGSFVEKCD